MRPAETTSGRTRAQTVGLFLGPALAIAVLFAIRDTNSPQTARMAAAAVLMAVWWVTEALPIPATALIPVALFPLVGIMKGHEVAQLYFNNVIFLFVGGFIMALAMQKWNLHRRIALRIITLIGGGPTRLILGFMIATAFLSMWISNTATAMMMVSIGLSVVDRVNENTETPRRLGTALMLSIAYAASIGGLATLIGTPPNLAFSKIFEIQFPLAPQISFAQWILFAFPISLVFLIVAWLVLIRLFGLRKSGATLERNQLKQEYRELGPWNFEQMAVMTLFVLMALLWLFRRDIAIGSFTVPGWSSLLPDPALVDDGTVAIVVALLLFLVPSRSNHGERLIDWKTATKLNWGIVILFGGGFALAGGFEQSGLSSWVATKMTGMAGMPPLLMIGSTCGLLTFLTELTSNTATTQIVLPLLGALAVSIKINPLLLMIPATLSASCAFMLPIATPPNAIIFGSGYVRMADMVRAGIILNLIGIVIVTAGLYLFGLSVFGIDLATVPSWAN